MIRTLFFCMLVLASASVMARGAADFSRAETDSALALRDAIAKESKCAQSQTYGKELRVWLKSMDWNSVTGVCSFVDTAGCRHVYGVGFAPDNTMGSEMANMRAKRNLALVLAPTVEATKSTGNGRTSSSVKVNTTLRGVMEVYSDTVRSEDGRPRRVSVVEQSNLIKILK